MQTSDNNIVRVPFSVQWAVKDAFAYRFRIGDPVSVARDAAQAAMREAVGRMTVDGVLRERREALVSEVRLLLQDILDAYDSGIEIQGVQLGDVQVPAPVRAAFDDVVAATQDADRMVNEAQGYQNQIIPQARAEATEIQEQAYALQNLVDRLWEQRVADAQTSPDVAASDPTHTLDTEMLRFLGEAVRHPVDLGELLTGLRSMTTALAATHAVDIAFDVDANVMIPAGNRVLLRQMLLGLISDFAQLVAVLTFHDFAFRLPDFCLKVVLKNFFFLWPSPPFRPLRNLFVQPHLFKFSRNFDPQD